MYKLAKLLHRPRGEFGNIFLLVPAQAKATDFQDLLVHRIHESGLASGDCYISEKNILYLNDHQTAECVAKMFRSINASPRSRRTRNEQIGFQIISSIRAQSPEMNQLVGSYLVSCVQAELFQNKKRREQRRMLQAV